MNKLLIILTFALALSACGGKKIVYKERVTEVPVIMVEPYQRPPEIEKLKDLPINQLTAEDKGDHDKISKAFAISVKMLQGKLEEYKEALQPYYSPFQGN